MEKKLSLLDRRDHHDPDRDTALLRESLRALTLENEALHAEVRDLRTRQQQMLDRLDQQAPQLQRVTAGHGQLQASLSHLHQRVSSTEQRINGLYDSRIWRTLVNAGSLVERALGMRRPVIRPAPPPLHPVRGLAQQRPEMADFPFCLDEPIEGQILYFNEMILRGWALFPQDSGKVEAAIDDGPWFEVPGGFARPDVAAQHSKHSAAENSGFVLRRELSPLVPGLHTLRVRLTAGCERQEEVRRSIRVASPQEHPASCEGGSVTPGDAIRLRIDTPRERELLFRGSSLSLSGWAVAETQIARVLVSVDDGYPQEATYGRMREDIGSHYAGFPGAAHGGFYWHGTTANLAPGPHRLRVQAVSLAGHTADASIEIDVDPHTAYEVWADRTTPTNEDLAEMRRQSLRWHDTPRISIITPVFRTNETFLKNCIESVKRQAYPNWELVLVDDGSRQASLTGLLDYYAGADPRIRLRTLTRNSGIAMATNAGLAWATGDFIGFLDHDDELSADALYQVARALREDRSLDVVYSDEDKIDAAGRRQEGFFKPEWSPDLLGSMNYICHFLVARRSLIERISGMRSDFDGSQDYDLVLRLTEETDRIRRIPRVLYHWRKHPESTASREEQKPAASEAGRRALAEHLERRGIHGRVQETSACRYRIHYDLAGIGEVTVVIPTGGSEKFVTAMDSLLANTSYRNFQVVVVDNSQGDDVIARVNRFQNSDVTITLLDHRNAPFNFSRLCNAGASATNSPYLVFLNDDTSIITPDWIETMLEHGQQKTVGAVGPLLLFPDDSIQHAGVIMGTYGTAGHAFRAMPEANGPYYYGFSHVVRNCSAVTGACMLVRREIFEKFGGFDEANLPTCFQDTDFCLKLAESGLRIVYTPFARLYHYESASKRVITGHRELAHMQKRWSVWIENDPFYNPNLSRTSDSFELDLG